MVLHFYRLTFADCQVLSVLFFFFGSLFFLMNNFKVPFFRPTIATSGKLKKHLHFLGSLCKRDTPWFKVHS